MTDPHQLPVKHGSYRIRRVGAHIHLNDNDSQFEDDTTTVAVGSQPREGGVMMQVTFDDGGFQEAYTGVTMSAEDARTIGEALLDAADDLDNEEMGWVTMQDDDRLKEVRDD